MNRNEVRACFREGFDVGEWVGDHQVAVEDEGGAFADACDDDGADGDVGNEVAVHDVDVEPFCAGCFDRADFLAETGEICGEDRWGDDDHRTFGSRHRAGALYI